MLKKQAGKQALTDLLVEKEQGDGHLKGKAPELVEALAEVDNAVCVGAHEIDHLHTHKERERESCVHVRSPQ